MALALNKTYKGWYAIKQKKPNQTKSDKYIYIYLCKDFIVDLLKAVLFVSWFFIFVFFVCFFGECGWEVSFHEKPFCKIFFFLTFQKTTTLGLQRMVLMKEAYNSSIFFFSMQNEQNVFRIKLIYLMNLSNKQTYKNTKKISFYLFMQSLLFILKPSLKLRFRN